MRIAVFLLPALLVYSGCANRGPKDSAQSAGASPDSASVAAGSEEELGRQIHQQILSSFYVYTAPEVVSYVNAVARKLGEHADRKKRNYSVTILYSEKIFSISAPGDHIYLTTGLMAFLENEAELAAVLGHEIGQLQFRDPRFSPGRKAWDSVLRGGATVGPAFGQIGALATLGLVLIDAAVQKSLPNPGKKLIESDTRALGYMLEAGYDPQGMLDLVRRFQHAPDASLAYLSDYLQSKPVTEERVQALEKSFSELSMEGRSLATQPMTYREMTRGMREPGKS